MTNCPRCGTELHDQEWTIHYSDPPQGGIILACDTCGVGYSIDSVCSECDQIDIGQTGEYPCYKCGVPRIWDNIPTIRALQPCGHPVSAIVSNGACGMCAKESKK